MSATAKRAKEDFRPIRRQIMPGTFHVFTLVILRNRNTLSDCSDMDTFHLFLTVDGGFSQSHPRPF